MIATSNRKTDFILKFDKPIKFVDPDDKWAKIKEFIIRSDKPLTTDNMQVITLQYLGFDGLLKKHIFEVIDSANDVCSCFVNSDGTRSFNPYCPTHGDHPVVVANETPEPAQKKTEGNDQAKKMVKQVKPIKK